MLYLTTSSIQGRRILHYHGIVSGAASLGDSQTGNFVNGNEMLLQGAKDDAMEKMSMRAAELGANAILGIAFEHCGVKQRLVTSVSGTAVTIE